ncbi:MAG: ABC transporter permease, partial [Thermoplasmata archaeon]|nr:ABC transporter permease [Thermoplasmata archaeon]
MSADALPVSDPSSFRRILSKTLFPRAVGAVSSSSTMGWRALLKIRHDPSQLLDVTAFPLMVTLLFTFLFGGALAGSPGEYIQFLLPGIVVQAIIFTTVYTGVGLATDIKKGIFERFRSLPIWQPAPLVGAVLGDTVRYSLAAVMVMGLGLILGFRPQGGMAGL